MSNTNRTAVLIPWVSQRSRWLLAFGCLVLLVAPASQAADTITLVNSPAALGSNDTTTWGQLGADSATLLHNFNATSTSGKSIGVFFATTTGILTQVNSTTSWGPVSGAFVAGDMALWSFDKSTNAGTGAVKFTFPTAAFGAGAVIQSHVRGTFTAKVELFNGATSLGSVTQSSNAAGDAFYIGARDTTAPNATSAVFSLTVAASNDNLSGNLGNFVVGTLSLNFSILAFTPASLAPATATKSTNQIITVFGGTTPYTTLNVMAFSAGTTGLTAANLTSNAGTGTIVLSGTPTAAGTATFTANVTDTINATASQNYTLTVNPALSIAPAALAAADAGSATNQTMTVTGGTTPYTTLNVTAFSAGTTGLTAANLTANAGAGTVILSGTPTAAGTCTFTVNVTDTAGATLTKNYSLMVNTALSIAPGALASATAGTATKQTITVSNGTTPYSTLTISGFSAGTTGLALANLTVNLGAGTVHLSGTPTAAGTCVFTVNVTDTAGAVLSKNYSLTVNAALTIVPGALASADAGTATNQTITVSNGTIPYTTLNESAFNAGTTGLTAASLTANAAAGTMILNGTPTAAGTCSFTVNVTDTAGATLTKNYSLTVNSALSIAPATLAGAAVGMATIQNITVSGGTTPYTTVNISAFAAGGTGLTAANLTANTGAGTVVLNGTPTAAGTCTFTVNVTDTAGATLSKNYSLTVVKITLTPPTLPNGVVYTPYSQPMGTTGGTGATTFAVTLGALPNGLIIDSNSGLISGTPTLTGAFNFTITATDSLNATGSQAYSVSMAPPTIALNPATLPNGTSGAPYNQPLSASGGIAAYTFVLTSGALPAGLTLSPAGLLSGTPTAAGAFNMTVQATDASTGTGPYSGTANYALTIGAPTVVLDVSNIIAGKTGTAYNATVTASGGVAPYTFAVTTGSLPAGFSLSAGGLINGTPTLESSAAFAITATDSSTGTGPFAGSAVATLTIDFKPVFTSGPSANANASISNLLGTFSASSDLPTAVFTWDFGDGSATATGATVSHLYAASGTYTVTVTAANPISGTSTAATLVIAVSENNVLADTTHVLHLTGTITYGKTSDTFIATGVFPLAAPVPVTGASLALAFNGLARNITFDAKGKFKITGTSAQLTVSKAPKTAAPLATVKLTLAGALKTALATGVATNANRLPLKLLSQFALNGQMFSDVRTLSFKMGSSSTSAKFKF